MRSGAKPPPQTHHVGLAGVCRSTSQPVERRTACGPAERALDEIVCMLGRHPSCDHVRPMYRKHMIYFSQLYSRYRRLAARRAAAGAAQWCCALRRYTTRHVLIVRVRIAAESKDDRRGCLLGLRAAFEHRGSETWLCQLAHHVSSAPPALLSAAALLLAQSVFQPPVESSKVVLDGIVLVLSNEEGCALVKSQDSGCNSDIE